MHYGIHTKEWHDMIANVEKKMHSNAPTYNANSREPLLFSRKNSDALHAMNTLSISQI